MERAKNAMPFPIWEMEEFARPTRLVENHNPVAASVD
jgi:hypothetical protein